MKKRNFLVLVLLLILGVTFVSALIIQTLTQSDFNEGNYNLTYYNTTYNAVQINSSNDSGNYTSEVFNAGSVASWDNLSWAEQRIQCPDNMVYINKLNGYCIDKYEASMPSANSTDMGNATEVADRNAGGSMLAESKKGVVPWVRISQINSRIACSNAGKHLCTDEEWLGASNVQGEVFNLPTNLAVAPYGCVTDSSTYCLDHSFELGEACNTGYNDDGESGCYSSEGVYDMTGNVWEWTNETVDVTNPDDVAGWKYANSTQGWQTTTGVETAIYGNDGVYFPLTTAGRAVIRGGSWSLGAIAGPFCAYLHDAPTSTYSTVGFRCCSS